MFISLPFVLALIFIKQILIKIKTNCTICGIPEWLRSVNLCVDTHFCLDCAGSWLMPSKIHLFYFYFIIKPTLCFCLELV